MLSNPKSSLHADTYKGINYSTNYYTASTVISHWFYMICQGKTGVNDNGKAFVVASIGMNKAEKIVYSSIKDNSVRNPTFKDFASQTILAAIGIYGDCSQEVISIRNAWYASGVLADTLNLSGGVQTCNFVINATYKPSMVGLLYTWTIPELGISNLTTTNSTFSVPYASWVGFTQINVTCMVTKPNECNRTVSISRTFNRPTFPTSPPCNMRLANPSIKTYPNPTDDLLNIELINLNSPVQNIMLINSLGNEVLREEKISLDFENTSTLSLKNLPDGIYYLTLSLEDGRQFSQKVVLQKGKIAN